MDQTSNGMSQSRMLSVSQHTTHTQLTNNRRKFVYKEPSVVPDQPSESESDSESDDGSQGDMEKDLEALDEEQAEIIRNINKMG